MNRRKFLHGSLTLTGLALLSGCGVLPSQTQPPARVPRIGHPTSGSAASPPQSLLAFLEGLRDLGYIDGQTMAFEIRYAEQRSELLPQLAAELVSLPVDVIVVQGNAAIRAATAATATIPIVMLASSDPVADGHVASLARPGGNVTGMSSIAVATVGKRLELLREFWPALGRLSVLWNTTEGGKAREFDELRGLARSLGVEVHSAGVTGLDDFDDGLAAVTLAHADALLVLADPLTLSRRVQIADFTIRNGLPSMHEDRESVLAGGLGCFGRNLPDLNRRAATYVDKILKGANPAELPVEQPTTFDLAINLKTAQAIGLTIPQSVLAQATELIQ